MQTHADHQLQCPAGYAIQKLKAFLDVGTIGEVFRINLESLNHGRPHGGQGALWAALPRDVAVLLYLMDELPAVVSAHGDDFLRAGVYDDIHLELGFTRRRSAHIHTCCRWPESRAGVQVFGRKGMIVYDEADRTLVLHRRFPAGNLGADPSALLDFGSFLLLEDRRRPSDRTDPCEGQIAGEALRILQSAERQLKHPEFKYTGRVEP